MAAVSNPKVDKTYDIFFSYEQQIEKKITKLYEIMKQKFEINIFFNLKTNKDNQINDSSINDSKIVVCCVTKAYTVSKKCQNEIAIAYTNDKPIIVLMFEKLNNQDINTIAFALSNISKFNLYDDVKIFDTWDGSLFEHITRSIESLLKRNIRKQRPEDRSFKKIVKRSTIGIRTPVSSVISSTTYDEKEQILPTATIISFEAEEYGSSQKEVIQRDETFDREVVNLIKLKSNSFLDFSYGYNRMVYLASKHRYLITSSYNKTIVSIDTNGNWIERRNPGGILRQPYSICLTPTDEILVGDNIAKCIFVFDVNLKYIKTIAEKTLNGFFDMVVDGDTNDVYAVSLYDSLIAIIDFKTGIVKRKIFLSTPAYIRVTTTKIFVISSADLIYAINKTNLQANYTIRIRNSKYLNGLSIDKEENVYTTAHEVHEDSEGNELKSKEVYLCHIIFKEDVQIKRVNLGLTQANDLVLFGNKQMIFISDTHVDLLSFDGFPKNEND
jgi:hypothetical protein